MILLSTAQQVDERIKGVESGADICLTLPFNVEYLKAVTEQLLKRNRSLKDYYKSSISAFELSDGKMLHQDDKEFIANFYKYAFVGVMLDWVKNDMKEDPKQIIDRLSTLMHGNVSAALERFSIS